MVGAVVLARLVDDPALAQRLLAAARAQPPAPPPTPLSLGEVRAFALAAGADDAGWVSLDACTDRLMAGNDVNPSQPSLLVQLYSKNCPHLFNKLLHVSFGKLSCLKHLVCQGHFGSTLLKLQQS
jgi:hypothetical protein